MRVVAPIRFGIDQLGGVQADVTEVVLHAVAGAMEVQRDVALPIPVAPQSALLPAHVFALRHRRALEREPRLDAVIHAGDAVCEKGLVPVVVDDEGVGIRRKENRSSEKQGRREDASARGILRSVAAVAHGIEGTVAFLLHIHHRLVDSKGHRLEFLPFGHPLLRSLIVPTFHSPLTHFTSE